MQRRLIVVFVVTSTGDIKSSSEKWLAGPRWCETRALGITNPDAAAGFGCMRMSAQGPPPGGPFIEPGEAERMRRSPGLGSKVPPALEPDASELFLG